MQHAKDTFYAVVRDRLEVVNPSRRILTNDGPRPAVLVAENQLADGKSTPPDAFVLHWGALATAYGQGQERPLLQLECEFRYRSAGSSEGGLDRGRSISAMDAELVAVLRPACARKRKLSQTPPLDLDTYIRWSAPRFESAEQKDNQLHRAARVNVFFYPEVLL